MLAMKMKLRAKDASAMRRHRRGMLEKEVSRAHSWMKLVSSSPSRGRRDSLSSAYGLIGLSSSRSVSVVHIG